MLTFHSFMIEGRVSLLEPATRNRLVELQRHFMAHGFRAWRGHRTVIAIGETIRAQSATMGGANCFDLLGIVLAAILSVALLKKGAAAGGATH